MGDGDSHEPLVKRCLPLVFMCILALTFTVLSAASRLSALGTERIFEDAGPGHAFQVAGQTLRGAEPVNVRDVLHPSQHVARGGANESIGSPSGLAAGEVAARPQRQRRRQRRMEIKLRAEQLRPAARHRPRAQHGRRADGKRAGRREGLGEWRGHEGAHPGRRDQLAMRRTVVDVCFLALGKPTQIDFSTSIIRNIEAQAVNSTARYHLLVDKSVRELRREMQTRTAWRGVPKRRVFLHSVADIAPKATALYRRLCRHATGPGPIYLYKPLLHLVLPVSVSRIIVLDTDLFLFEDIGGLWAQFDRFGPREPTRRADAAGCDASRSLPPAPAP